MRKVRSYLREGWTLREWSSEEGHAAYWLVSPLDEDIMSFPTKREARAHWDKHGTRMRKIWKETAREVYIPPTEAEGRALAEECGLDWDDLDEFERVMWTNAAGKKNNIK